MEPKTYVITTAQRGALPNWEFLKSLETYCQHNNAELIILPTNGRYPSSTKADQEEVLHPYLQANFRNVDHDLKLNSKIWIRDFPVKAQQMIPLTSWGRFVQYDRSAIMASPKLMQRCYPNSNQDLPKILMSTGAVTRPHYKNNSWGEKAKLDHRYAAIVVEVKDEETYHYRQLNSLVNGTFYDLGIRYRGEETPSKEPVDALVLGDVHVGVTDPKVVDATYRLIEELEPKHILYHDLCDCYSVNHHHLNDIVLQAQKSRNGEDSLFDEAKAVGQYLTEMVARSPKKTKHLVVKSNHDEAIDRYLREGRFAQDPQNLRFAAELLINAIDEEKDTLERAVELAHRKLPKQVKFLQPDKDFKIRGWQLASHGHYGPRGRRGSVRSLEGVMGRGIVGHFHSPQIFRDIWVAGTSTRLDLHYTRGHPSDWLQAHVVLSPNGKPQLVNIIDGEYR